MEIKILYRYIEKGRVVDSLNASLEIGEQIERYRLVADEGFVLTIDGENKYSVIDIDQDQLSLWYEIEAPVEKEKIKKSSPSR